MTDNTELDVIQPNLPSRKHTKFARNTDPRKRDVVRHDTQLIDIAHTALAWWKVSKLMENVVDTCNLHNSQQKVNRALMHKAATQAKSLDVSYGRKDCFKTLEQTESIYRALVEEEKRQLSKETTSTQRVKTDITFS